MKRERPTMLATIQVILGVVFFGSGLLISDVTQLKTALYVCGLVTVLIGIVTALLLTTKR